MFTRSYERAQVVHATGGHNVRMGNPGALRYDQAGNPTESKILLMNQMCAWETQAHLDTIRRETRLNLNLLIDQMSIWTKGQKIVRGHMQGKP